MCCEGMLVGASILKPQRAVLNAMMIVVCTRPVSLALVDGSPHHATERYALEVENTCTSN